MVESAEVGSSYSGTQTQEEHQKFYMAKTVIKGSAVLHVVSGHIRFSQTIDIVLGKETSVELATIDKDGIVQTICDQSVYGTIKDISILKWNEDFRESTAQTYGKDLLVVLSDSGKLSFLTFSNDLHRFLVLAQIHLSSPGNSRHQLGRMLAVHPSGSSIAVSAYDERFAVFSISKSAGCQIVDEKLASPPEHEGDATAAMDFIRPCARGTIWSMCFIPNESRDVRNPLLAVLMNRRAIGENHLIVFECNFTARSLHLLFRYSEDGLLAHHISSVPHLPGYALLFRMSDILLLDIRDPSDISSVHRVDLDSSSVIEEQSPFEDPMKDTFVDDDGMSNVARALLKLRDSFDDDPMNIDSGSETLIPTSKYVVSWSWEPIQSANSKLIFCLDTGELHVLDIYSEGGEVKINLSDVMYKGLPCNKLLWAVDGLIACFVDMGDGTVLKFEDGRVLYKYPIQNIAPILDLSVENCPDDKQDKMFACCGMNPEGSIRIIRNGMRVEKLLKTSPIYKGITGTWTLRMKKSDDFHSFLVLSFVEETRVLSVGSSFNDVTDAVGFQPDACTLACGLLADGLLVQIHSGGARLCLPTTLAHIGGISVSQPICTSWTPHNMSISSGAVGHNFIIVSTSNPCFLFVLGLKSTSSYQYEIFEIQRVKLEHEVSCISIPTEGINHEKLESSAVPVHRGHQIGIPVVIGTHAPSVKILSVILEEGLRVHAVGNIHINDALGTPISDYVPEDVKLVSVEKSYVLAGLRNGMLLRFEWPSISDENVDDKLYTTHDSPMENGNDSNLIVLELVAVRRVGIAPVVLVPLSDSLYSDLIVLSDKPWLLHSARHSIQYTSISFQPATHVTPVCFADCLKGILFVADNSLHLVEMVLAKRLNVQKLSIEGTPRKVIYHHESKTLLVMRIGLTGTCASDVCRIDSFSGSVISKFSLECGETAKCMEIVKVGNEKVLVVGTCQYSGRPIMASGEAECTTGRLIVLRLESAHRSSDSCSHMVCSNLSSPSQINPPIGEIVGHATEQLSNNSLSPDGISNDVIKLEDADSLQFNLLYQSPLPGAILSVCSYLNRYFLVSAGNALHVFGFLNDNPHRLKKFAVAKTRFAITCLATCFSRIAVGDCRDGILFYSYQEDHRKLEQIYADPVKRLVADCSLVDMETVVVSDRCGNISVLSCTNHLKGNKSPEKNLMLNCSFFLGETIMSIHKGSFLHKLPVDGVLNYCSGIEVVSESSYNSVVAGGMLGSVVVLIPVTRGDYELLKALEEKLIAHPLTSPISGNNHKEFRARGPMVGPTMLDGDLLAQFLELTTKQQEDILATISEGQSSKPVTDSDLCSSSGGSLSLNKVICALEKVNFALN